MSVPPEGRLLLACLRAECGTESVDQVPSGIDWERFVSLVTRHSVSPLVAAAIDELDNGTVPTPVRTTLEKRTAHIARRNLRLLQEVGTLCESLRESGIRVIPYRGPVLASLVYADIARRPFGDLDLLVDRADIPAIRAHLLEAGYEPAYEFDSTTALSPAQEYAYQRVEREYSFEHAGDDIEVELHWKLVSRLFPTRIDLDSLWDRHETLSVAGTEIPVLSADDRLFCCCVHGTRHRWERLHWASDVALLLERETIDWDTIYERAAAQRCERMLTLGLAIANDLFDAPLPESVRRRIADDPRLEALRPHVLERLFDETQYWELDERRYQARTLDRRRDVARFWANWVFRPRRTDVESIDLPRPLTPCYSLVRTARLGASVLSRLLPGGKSRTSTRWH